MKRVFAVVAMLFVALFMDVEVHAATDGNYEYELVEDENGVITAELTAYMGDEKEVTVPSTVKGYTVTSIYSRCFENCTTIESVVIPDSVVTIGESAFTNCTKLKKVALPSKITEIPTRAFTACVSLEEIVIPESVKTIKAEAFRMCRALKKVTMKKVERISGYAFWDCESLETVELGDALTELGGHCFDGCTSLRSIHLPATLTTFRGYDFKDCTSLVEVTYEKDETFSWIVDGTFSGCTSLKEFDFPECCNNIGRNAFQNCEALEKLVFPQSVTRIDRNAFAGCKALFSIEFTEEPEQLQIWDEAFKDCTALVTITVPKTTSIIEKGAFSGCTALQEFVIEENPDYVEEVEGEVVGGSQLTARYGTVEKLPEPFYGHAMGQRLEMGEDIFKDCTSLKRIRLPFQVVWILAGSFKGCENLEEVIVENAYCELGVIGAMFDADSQAVVKSLPVSMAKKYCDEYGQSFESMGIRDGFMYAADGITRYWYEGGVRQGYDPENPAYRGKEIYDPLTDAWYWLDNVNQGAVALSKDVYQESQADAEGNMGKWVRYDDYGYMIKGWTYQNNKTYYFDPIYGTMYKGWKTVDGISYYFNENTGICGEDTDIKQGWYVEDGKEYWYEDGVRQGYNPDDPTYRGKEIYDPIKDAWFWLDNVYQGAKAVDKEVYQESLADDEGNIGKWVRYDEEGYMIKGWYTAVTLEEEKIYYYDYTYGTMYKGWKEIDGEMYHFHEEQGYWIE